MGLNPYLHYAYILFTPYLHPIHPLFTPSLHPIYPLFTPYLPLRNPSLPILMITPTFSAYLFPNQFLKP